MVWCGTTTHKAKKLEQLDNKSFLRFAVVFAAMEGSSFYVLFDSSSGFALFSVLESEQIATLLDEVQNGLTDLARFQRVVKMVAFLPFTTAENALENMNAITEHELSEDLKVPIMIMLPYILYMYCDS